jgi:hypothetical protein
MQIWNQMGYPHQFTMGMDKAGHEYVVVVVKGTFDFPETSNGPVRKSVEQTPLVFADIQTGEPGYSATLWETDFAFRKPRCDVILNGCAYAPGGRPAERVPVGIKIGNWTKLIEVVGNREWRAVGPLFTSTAPEPFLKMPITYDRAWGGIDRLNPEEALPGAYLRNPVGTGWAQTKNQRFIPGLRLPNTQKIGEDIRSPFGDYTPMSFGPMGRGWPGRIEYGGTYDRNWVDNIAPFLPPDFDERYFQMAPADQQIDLPTGGEEVQLINLSPVGRIGFRLPDTKLPIRLFKGRQQVFNSAILPDSVLLDPEQNRFSFVWRTTQRIERTVLDFTECWIGAPTPSMLRAMETGRRYVRVSGVNADTESEDA